MRVSGSSPPWCSSFRGAAEGRLRSLDQRVPVAPQEVVDRFDSDPNRPRGTVLIEVPEREERCARRLNDLLHDAVDRGVVTATKTRDLESDEVGMTGHYLGGPQLAVRRRVE